MNLVSFRDLLRLVSFVSLDDLEGIFQARTMILKEHALRMKMFQFGGRWLVDLAVFSHSCVSLGWYFSFQSAAWLIFECKDSLIMDTFPCALHSGHFSYLHEGYSADVAHHTKSWKPHAPGQGL